MCVAMGGVSLVFHPLFYVINKFERRPGCVQCDEVEGFLGQFLVKSRQICNLKKHHKKRYETFRKPM